MAAKKLRDKKKSEKLILEKQVLDLLRFAGKPTDGRNN